MFTNALMFGHVNPSSSDKKVIQLWEETNSVSYLDKYTPSFNISENETGLQRFSFAFATLPQLMQTAPGAPVAPLIVSNFPCFANSQMCTE